MSREMPAANTETYRVTITVKYLTGRGFSRTYGPFATASAAKSARTREMRAALHGRHESVVTALIERSVHNWEVVELS